MLKGGTLVPAPPLILGILPRVAIALTVGQSAACVALPWHQSFIYKATIIS